MKDIFPFLRAFCVSKTDEKNKKMGLYFVIVMMISWSGFYDELFMELFGAF